MGYDIYNVGNIDTTILDMKRHTSSKVLSILFKGEFKETLHEIATKEYYIDLIKENLDGLMHLIQDKKLSHVISQVLQMFVKYNKDLGDWIISKLLDIHCDSKQVSLLYSLIKCNPKDFLNRLQILKDFILRNCAELTGSNKTVNESDLVKIIPFMQACKNLVSVYLGNLRLKDWCQTVFDDPCDFQTQDEKLIFINQKCAECLSLTLEELKCLLQLEQAVQQAEPKPKKKNIDYLVMFIVSSIVYGKIVGEDNKPIKPTKIVQEYLLDDVKYQSKIELASIVIANLSCSPNDALFDTIQKKINIMDIVKLLEDVETKDEVDEQTFNHNLSFWINCLYSDEFRNKMATEDTGIKLYNAITKVNLKDPTKLTLLIKKQVIDLIIKLTIGSYEKETLLAKRIIEDLEFLKDKRDIEFVNNILNPLLKAENKVPVTFNFYNGDEKTYYTFSGAIVESSESPKNDNFLSKPELATVVKHLTKHVDAKYNSHRFIASKWKAIYTSGEKISQVDYEKFVKAFKRTTNVFLIVEGYSKEIGDSCTFGVYNRNGCYMKGDEVHVKTSDDNFCFAIIGKSEQVMLSVKPENKVIEFGKDPKTQEISFGEGLFKIPFPNSGTSEQGSISKASCNIISISDSYAPLKDFKLEKMTLWTLDGMKEATGDILQESKANNPITPIYDDLITKSEQSKALNCYRESCFLLPSSITLEELGYEIFGFQTAITCEHAGSSLSEIYANQKQSAALDNIIDFTLNFEEFVDKANKRKNDGNKPVSSSKKYIPQMGIFDCFDKEGGVTKLISITQKSVAETWKNKQLSEKWGLWLQELESFTKLPLFFQLFIKDKHFKDLLFEILAGVPDQETSNSQHWVEKQVEAVKLTYKIIKEMFQMSKHSTLRDKAAENGLIEKILLRLKEVTGEFERKFLKEGEEEIEEVKVEQEEKKETEEAKPVKNYEKKKRKGVGYTTGVGKTWNVNQYIKNKKVKNEQISYLIDILSNFFRTKDWSPTQDIVDNIMESCLLPLVENAFRTGSLLDMVKFNKLYISYLRLVRVFAKNKPLAATLIDIGGNYRPRQIEPIFKLLEKLNDLANIYSS